DALKDFLLDLQQTPQSVEDFFKEFFIVSRIIIAQSPQGLPPSILKGLFVHIDHAPGTKCPRCWQWDVTSDPNGLCNRCQRVLARV
ncbi:MAG TPA: hypothetical protein VHA52_00215, partial [Candidatus Babeliaceae bacterium]|nr:hypothetical protein [Candidatus Babeliaceae bacterium]